MNRRYFLKQGGVAIAGLGSTAVVPGILTRAVAANGATAKAGGGTDRVLIVIFQRGAMDGLNAVIPHGESDYYRLRPSIAVPKPNGTPEAALDLDGFFGLHPAMAALKPFYDARQLAMLHAVGSHDQTRSHFDAQDYLESGTPGVKSTSDGWLNRSMQASRVAEPSPFRGVALGPSLPRILQGSASGVAISSLDSFGVRDNRDGGAQKGFEEIYARTVSEAMRNAGRETFEAVDLLKRVNPRQYQPLPGVQYPRGAFGDRLRQIAQLVKSRVGLEVAFTDIGGWDTHANQGNAQGQLAARLRELSLGVSALYQDLREFSDKVAILTMTEFGRTAKENGNRGTDHGHASAMFLLGGKVAGGKVHGRWPGLAADRLYEGRDLAVTTDFRHAVGEVLHAHLGVRDLTRVFPGYSMPGQPIGLFS